MRVVRFLIQPIWSRRASLCAVPSALTVLPAAAAMAREAPARSPLLCRDNTALYRVFSWESTPRLNLPPQRRLAPEVELKVSAEAAKTLSWRAVPVRMIELPTTSSLRSLYMELRISSCRVTSPRVAVPSVEVNSVRERCSISDVVMAFRLWVTTVAPSSKEMFP